MTRLFDLLPRLISSSLPDSFQGAFGTRAGKGEFSDDAEGTRKSLVTARDSHFFTNVNLRTLFIGAGDTPLWHNLTSLTMRQNRQMTSFDPLKFVKEKRVLTKSYNLLWVFNLLLVPPSKLYICGDKT